MRDAHWVEPKLVAEVSFAEWTHDGKLRQASFEGLREDKRAREIVREQPVHAASTPAQSESDSDTGDVVAGVPISNGDKVLYPEDGITKRTLARYYEAIGELMGTVDTNYSCTYGVSGTMTLYELERTGPGMNIIS